MRTSTSFVVMAKPVGPVCNLACDYCYYVDKKSLFPIGENFRMSPEVLEALIASFISASPGPVVHFGWHGGEPTLAGIGFFQRALDIQSRLLPEGWRCVNNIQTNGSLLDERWCRFLASNRFAVGISIDGPAELHDACRAGRRGRPSHARAMHGLGMLRASGVDPDVLCTLNAVNAAHPREVYRFFLDNDVKWVQFLPVVQRPFDSGDLSVRPEAMGEFLCTVFDEWVRYDIEQMGVQNFLECLLVAQGIVPNLCVMSRTCGRVLAVEHDGGVYSCDHFVAATHRLGDLSDGLAGLVDSPAQLSFGAAKWDGLPGCCRRCEVLRFCNGGCPKDRFAVSAEGEDGLNYLCAGYRRFYAHVTPYVRRMAALVAEHKPVSAISAELALAEGPERARWRATGRNDPCPCGSGQKYKHCCWSSRRR